MSINLWQQFNAIAHQDAMERYLTLNLNASENHTSQLVRHILAQHPCYDNYEFPPSGGDIVGPWQFTKEPYNEQLVTVIADQCQELLGSPHISVRPRGGQAAEIALLLALGKTGDTLFYVQETDGGHFGLTHMAKHCGMQLLPIPFHPTTHFIDTEQLLINMKKVWCPNSTKVMMINQSFVLRPQRWQHLIETIKHTFPDCVITCDLSHTIGLIMGKQLPNPLQAGVDIIHASTHKTLPGPQKAIILFNPTLPEKYQQAIHSAVSPTLQSYCGTSEIMALSAALFEMQCYAAPYAQAVCQTAKAMAEQLSALKCQIIGKAFNYTQTHQIWLIIGNESQAWQACANLHRANIRVLPALIPFSTDTTQPRWGIRLGTNALVRRGMTVSDITQIADWIAAILKHQESPAEVKKQVLQLSARFPLNKLHYTADYLLSQLHFHEFKMPSIA